MKWSEVMLHLHHDRVYVVEVSDEFENFYFLIMYVYCYNACIIFYLKQVSQKTFFLFSTLYLPSVSLTQYPP